MPKTKTTSKAVAKKKSTKKPAKKSSRPKKWNDQHRAVSRLLEDELQGLLQYLRALHYIALVLILTSVGVLIYALRILFENSQHAVVGFLLIIATALAVIFSATMVLRPWILPRFLLPLDLNQLEINQLMNLFKNPDEYHVLLKNHIQILTENFLIPKLRRLRNTVALLIFGISIAIILAIALP